MINFGLESLPLTDQEFDSAQAIDSSISKITYTRDYFDNLYYKVNGPLDMCVYDPIVPLKKIAEANGLEVAITTSSTYIQTNQKFVYTLSFSNPFKWINGKETYNVLDDIPQYIVDSIINKNCLLLIHFAHELGFHGDTTPLISIKKSLEDKNIKLGNVILLANTAYNLGGDLGEKYKEYVQGLNFKLITWEFFETTSKIISKELTLTPRYTDPSKLKKFVCLNRRPKLFRCVFMHKIYNRDLLKYFTMTFPKDNDIIKNAHENLDLPEVWNQIVEQDSYKEICNTLPWVYDDSSWKVLECSPGVYEDHLINVTFETYFGGRPDVCFLTEKTFKPIYYKMPFIIIGDPGTLTKLKNLGYKTFNDYWDESYDLTMNMEERMEKICNLIENLSEMPIEMLQAIVQDMQPILDHNYNILQSSQAEAEFINALREFV